MNLKIIKKIENISEILVFTEEYIIYKNLSKNIISMSIDSFLVNAEIHVECDHYSLYEKNNILYSTDENNLKEVDPKNLNEKILWATNDKYPYLIEDNIVYERSSCWKSSTNKIWLYNLQTKNLIAYKTYEKAHFGSMDELYFLHGIGFRYIERITLLDKKRKWRFDFDKNEKSSGSIHRHNNILLVPSTTLDEYGFIDGGYIRAIDLETGEVLWKDIANDYLYQDKNTGLLYTFWGNLTIVDPAKGVIFDEPIVDDATKKLYPSSSSCHLDYPYLYFSTRNHHELPIHLGRVNVKTKTLDFILPSDVGPETKLSSFAYHDQRFYLLDMKNVLHIYEMNE